MLPSRIFSSWINKKEESPLPIDSNVNSSNSLDEKVDTRHTYSCTSTTSSKDVSTKPSHHHRLLLIGEGDFTFTKAFVQSFINLISSSNPIEVFLEVVATSYDDIDDLLSRYSNCKTILEEISSLIESTTNISSKLSNMSSISCSFVHGVDVTSLGECQSSHFDVKFDTIAFNFPHIPGKMKIDKNRELLSSFFKNTKPLLRVTNETIRHDSESNEEERNPIEVLSEVRVTLAYGQGGSIYDFIYDQDESHIGNIETFLLRLENDLSFFLLCEQEMPRKYGNTWKIIEQAAKFGYICKDIIPFEIEYWREQGYESKGRRAQGETGFNAKKSLTYVFVSEGCGVNYLKQSAPRFQHDICFWIGYAGNEDESVHDLWFEPQAVFDIIHSYGEGFIREIEFKEAYVEPQEKANVAIGGELFGSTYRVDLNKVSTEVSEIQQITPRRRRVSHLYRIIYQASRDQVLYREKTVDIQLKIREKMIDILPYKDT